MKERDWSCGADHRRRVRKLMLQKDIRPVGKLGNPSATAPKGRFSVVEHRFNGGGSHYFVHGTYRSREEAETHVKDVWESIYRFTNAYHASEWSSEEKFGKTFQFFYFSDTPDIMGFAVTVEYDFDEDFANANRLVMIRRRHRIADMWNGDMRITEIGSGSESEPPPHIE